MNIGEVKAVISAQSGFVINTLDIHEQKDVNGVVDPNWVSAWFDVQRVRVTMHREVFDQIKANKAFNGLAVKAPEVVRPEGKQPYTRFVIITPTSILDSF